MKASVKLRDDDRRSPLLRLKLPISILGLPLVSAASAGDPGELALHLRTALPSGGPTLKLTYHPTPLPPYPPLSLTLKSGAGPFGSPASSPLTISARLSLSSPAPSFTIHLKPQIGDFSFKKSAASRPPNPSAAPKENGGGVHHPLPISLPPRTGLDEIISSGAAVSTVTTLPVARRAVLVLRWGVNVGASAGKWRLPYLTVEKISIERVDEGEVKRVVPAAKVEAGDAEMERVKGMCVEMRKEVEELRRESGLINKSFQQLQMTAPDGRRGGSRSTL